MTKCRKPYSADVWDILVHSPTADLRSQRVYRVVAVRLGGLGEEGLVELAPLGLTSKDAIRVPFLLLDECVRAGVMACVWRKP